MLQRDRGFIVLALFGATALALGLLTLLGAMMPDSTIASPMHFWLLSGMVPLILGLGASRVAARMERAGLIVRFAAGSATSFATWTLTLVAVGFVTWLLLTANRLYALPIACVQYGIMRTFSGPEMRRPLQSVALFLACLLAWVVSVPLSFVALNDLLMSASSDFSLATLAFVLTLLFITSDMADSKLEHVSNIALRRIELAVVALGFVELALRVDHLGSDWIPYHRSYWAGPADFIRQGHWLLWDIPSQYGFFSELAISLMPVASVWQGLFLLTAIVLVAQAVMTFMVLRHDRKGYSNLLVSLVICIAVFFASEAARDPYSARLYPQQGLRFLWQTFALFCAWKTYIYRNDAAKARFFRAAGWIGWTLCLFWSFEAAVWTTLVWLGFIGTEAICSYLDTAVPHTRRVATIALSIALTFLLPGAVVAGIEACYYAHFGHGPDWSGYFEFSGIYANSDVTPLAIRANGPGLIIVGLLCGSAAIGYLILARRALHALPVVAAAFAAIWGVSVYYAGEPYDAHVNAMMEIFVIACAVIASVVRREAITSPTGLIARVMLLPSLIILATTTLGEPGIIAKINAPFMPGYDGDSTHALPAITGELAELIRRIDTQGNTNMILPNRASWVKADLGMVMPFLIMPDGRRRELHAWLPMSPVGAYNTMYTLPLERRQIYTDRYLAQGTRETGWYITYHEVARCESLSQKLHTQRIETSENFTAAYCVTRH